MPPFSIDEQQDQLPEGATLEQPGEALRPRIPKDSKPIEAKGASPIRIPKDSQPIRIPKGSEPVKQPGEDQYTYGGKIQKFTKWATTPFVSEPSEETKRNIAAAFTGSEPSKVAAEHPAALGVTEGVIGFGRSLTTPFSIATLAGGPLVGAGGELLGLSPVAVQTVSRTLSGLFAAQAARGTYVDAQAAYQAYRKGNNREAARAATEAVFNLGAAAFAGKHAMRGAYDHLRRTLGSRVEEVAPEVGAPPREAGPEPSAPGGPAAPETPPRRPSRGPSTPWEELGLGGIGGAAPAETAPAEEAPRTYATGGALQPAEPAGPQTQPETGKATVTQELEPSQGLESSLLDRIAERADTEANLRRDLETLGIGPEEIPAIIDAVADRGVAALERGDIRTALEAGDHHNLLEDILKGARKLGPETPGENVPRGTSAPEVRPEEVPAPPVPPVGTPPEPPEVSVPGAPPLVPPVTTPPPAAVAPPTGAVSPPSFITGIVQDVRKGNPPTAAPGAPKGRKDTISAKIAEFIKRAAMDAQGQDILDDMIENKESPSEIENTFWTDTYFKLPGNVQKRFQTMLKNVSGMQPGDYIGNDKDGNPIVAKTWMDIAAHPIFGNYLGDEAEYLEGTQRGYAVLMREANRALAGVPSKTQAGGKAPRGKVPPDPNLIQRKFRPEDYPAPVEGAETPPTPEAPPIPISDKDIENWRGVAGDLVKITAAAKAHQLKFLNEKGMTWEQARALDEAGQQKLQAEYTEWLKTNPLSETPAAPAPAAGIGKYSVDDVRKIIEASAKQPGTSTDIYRQWLKLPDSELLETLKENGTDESLLDYIVREYGQQWGLQLGPQAPVSPAGKNVGKYSLDDVRAIYKAVSEHPTYVSSDYRAIYRRMSTMHDDDLLNKMQALGIGEENLDQVVQELGIKLPTAATPIVVPSPTPSTTPLPAPNSPELTAVLANAGLHDPTTLHKVSRAIQRGTISDSNQLDEILKIAKTIQRMTPNTTHIAALIEAMQYGGMQGLKDSAFTLATDFSEEEKKPVERARQVYEAMEKGVPAPAAKKPRGKRAKAQKPEAATGINFKQTDTYKGEPVYRAPVKGGEAIVSHNPGFPWSVQLPNGEEMGGYKTAEEAMDAVRQTPRYQLEEPRGTIDVAFARVAGGKVKLGADAEALGKVLGSSLYGKDKAEVITKELLQNAMDAIRATKGLKEVTVEFNTYDHTITITDTGNGMTRHELETVFTDLGASGKRSDATASGGFGLAKAAPLMMSQKLTVTTISKEKGKFYRHTFEATPAQLLNEGVEIKTEQLPSDAGIETGTVIESELDPDISFYAAQSFAENSRNSIRLPGRLIVKGGNSYRKDDELPKMKRAATASVPGANIDVYVDSTGTKELGGFPYIEVDVNNNGIFQFTHGMYPPKEATGVAIPKRIAIDIRASVPEGDDDYPFTANREQLRGPAGREIGKLITEKIIRDGINAHNKKVATALEDLPSIKIGAIEIPIFDSGERMTDTEIKAMQSDPAVIDLAHTIDRLTKEAIAVLSTADLPYSLEGLGKKIRRVGLVLSDKVHGVHITDPVDKTKTLLFVNPFAGIKDNAARAASLIWHTIKHEIIHDAVSGHTEEFTKAEAVVSAALGAKHEIRAIEDLEDVYGDPSEPGGIRPDLSRALQLYAESRERREVAPDIFGGENLDRILSPGDTESLRTGGEGTVPERDRGGVGSPEFHTQVADENGKPLVVYHGTTKDVSALESFDPDMAKSEGKAFFFSHSPTSGNKADNANTYASKGTVMPVYLRVDRLYESGFRTPIPSDEGDWDKWIEENEKFNRSIDWTKNEYMEGEIAKAKRLGYDGIVFRNIEDDRHDSDHAFPTDVYAVFSPSQIKSAIGNRGTYDPDDPNILFDVQTGADIGTPVWYLKSERVIGDKMKGPMPGPDVLRMLRNNGVSEEELKWTGLDDYLPSAGRVSPDDVKDHIAENAVKVEEVTKGAIDPSKVTYKIIPSPTWPEMSVFYDGKLVREGVDDFDPKESPPQELQELAVRVAESDLGRSDGAAKYASRVLPGGENYRELLLTLPTLGRDATYTRLVNEYQAAEKASYDYMDSHGVSLAQHDPEMQSLFHRVSIAKEALDQFKAKKDKEGGWGYTFRPDAHDFTAGHWDEPNVVVHVRANDRTTPDGKKLLHIEEIQSDWHQKGRKYRYADPKIPFAVIGVSGQFATREEAEAAASAANVPRSFIRDERTGELPAGVLPDAPFKKTWQEVALRRMIRYAAENGYDGVSWTGGEDQAERYDQSRQIKSIEFAKTFQDKFHIVAKAHDGRLAVDDVYDKEKLPDVIGKEMADKIIERTEAPDAKLGQPQTLSGLDLKIGGEGMRGFYDKIVPDYLNKFGKKFGARVATAEAEVPDETLNWRYVGPPVDVARLKEIRFDEDMTSWSMREDARKVLNEIDHGVDPEIAVSHSSPQLAALLGGKLEPPPTPRKTFQYLPITPAMRDSVLKEGVPLFNLKKPGVPRPMPPATGAPRPRKNIVARETLPGAKDYDAKRYKNYIELKRMGDEREAAEGEWGRLRDATSLRGNMGIDQLRRLHQEMDQIERRRRSIREYIAKLKQERDLLEGGVDPNVGEVRLDAKGNPRLYLNRTAMNMIGNAMRPGKKGAAHGVQLSIGQTRMMRNKLITAGPANGDEQKIFQPVMRLIEAAMENSRHPGIVLVGKMQEGVQSAVATEREEVIHRWQRMRSRDGRTTTHLQSMAFWNLFNSLPSAAYDYLRNNEYEHDPAQGGTELYVIETAAKIMAGKREEMGVTEDQAVDWLAQYYDEVMQEHGPEAIIEVEHTIGFAREMQKEVEKQYGPAATQGSGSTGAGEKPDTSRPLHGVSTGGQGGAETGAAQGEAAGRGIDTPEFKAWFGDSKIVDENGEPLRVYHGTRTPVDFSEFSTEGPPSPEDDPFEEQSFDTGSGADPTAYLGAHFAKEPSVANQFAQGAGWMKTRFQSDQPKPRVIPVYLSIQNPKDFGSEQNLRNFIYQGKPSGYAADAMLEEAMRSDNLDPDDSDDPEVEEWNQKYENDPAFRRQQNRWIIESKGTTEDNDDLEREFAQDLARQAHQRLAEQGHDGVIYENVVEGGTSYVAFEPTQIKSAIGNAGTYDSESADILMDARKEKGIPAGLQGLAAEARKYPTFEEFRKAFSHEIKHGTYWHVTDDPNFTIDAAKGPRDMSSIGGGGMRAGTLMITSHLDYWADYYGKSRPYAAQIDMSEVPPSAYTQVNRGFGNEFNVNDPSKAKVLKVVPIAQAKQFNRRAHSQLPGSNEALETFWKRARETQPQAAGAGKPLYHVTLTENLKKIKSEGLQRFKTSNWVKAASGKRYGKGEIYAFENLQDAVRWGGKMDWEFNQTMGSGKISIVKFTPGDRKWDVDTADPLSQGSAKGRWLKSKAAVPAGQIVGSATVTQDAIKALVQNEEPELDFADEPGGKFNFADPPLAGDEVDGLTVGEDIPNTGSIDASMSDPEELKGIREIPLDEEWNAAPEKTFYAANDIRRVHALAEQIEASGRIDPLIVRVENGELDILEGRHRLSALHVLGKKSFPALVVIEHDPGKPPFDVKKRPDEPAPDDRMMALHNTSAEGILAADRLGGIPAPSLAIVKPGMRFESFGDITLVGNREMVDPDKNPYSKLYTSDVYSPRQPRSSRKLSEKEADKFEAKVRAAIPESYREALRARWSMRDSFNSYQPNRWDELIRQYKNATSVQYAYLESIGKAPKLTPQPVRLQFGWLRSPEVGEALQNDPALAESFGKGDKETIGKVTDLAKAAILTEAERDAAKLDTPSMNGPKGDKVRATTKKLLLNGAKDWIEKHTDENGLLHHNTFVQIADEMRLIAKGDKPEIDRYDADQKVREALKENGGEDAVERFVKEGLHNAFGPEYLQTGRRKEPYTLEAVRKAMLGKGVRGQEDTMTHGLGKARAVSAKQFPSIEAMRGKRDMIQNAEENKAAHDALEKRFFALADQLEYKYPDAWDSFDALGRAMGRYMKGPKTESGMKRALMMEDYETEHTVPDVLREGMELAKDVADAPVEYFESKLTNAVTLADFSGAAVPENTDPEVISTLKRKGLQVETYKRHDRDDRAKAVQRIQDDDARGILFDVKKKPELPEWDGEGRVPPFVGREPGGKLSKIQMVPIKSLIPTEGALDHNSVDDLVSALLYDDGKPIPAMVVERDNKPGKYFIVDGHHRYAAAKRAGYKMVPIRIYTHPEDVQAERQLNAAIDKANSHYESLTPHEICHGHCYEWAEKVAKSLPDSKIKDVDLWPHRGKDALPYHVWVDYQGKSYDAETPNGVANWRQLPYFKEHANQAIMPKLKSRTVPSRVKPDDEDGSGIKADEEKQPERLSPDHVPPEPGTLPIPPKTVRLFHYTQEANLDSIREQGLLESKGRGDDLSGSGPSAGVWASTKAPSTSDLRSRPYVEFYATADQISRRANYPDKRWQINPETGDHFKEPEITQETLDEFSEGYNHVIMDGDVPTAQILAIHEPWMDHARHLMERWHDPGMEHMHDPKELDDWQGDAWRDFRRAIEYVQKESAAGRVPISVRSERLKQTKKEP